MSIEDPNRAIAPPQETLGQSGVEGEKHPLPDLNDGFDFPERVDDERWKEISQYFWEPDGKGSFKRGIFEREESIYRLDREARAETDPNGIDPTYLLSPKLKRHLLGQFVKQDFGDFPYPAKPLIAMRDFKPSRNNTPIPAYLHYRHGDIRVRHEYPNSIEAILNAKQKGRDISARWRISADPRQTEPKLLAVDIETVTGKAYMQSHAGLVYRENRRIVPIGVKHEKDREGYSIGFDPFYYLASLYREEIDPTRLKNGEDDFIEFWKNRFGQLRLNEATNLYPNQLVHSPPGLSLDIFEGAVAMAEKSGYGGVTSTPEYFHTAENFEKQGLRFERKDTVSPSGSPRGLGVSAQ